MGSQSKFMFVRSLSGALMMTTLATALSTPAFARDSNNAEGSVAGRLPANVLCWPANANGTTLAEHNRDGKCNPKSADSLRPIDLKTPFRQFNVEGQTHLNVVLGAPLSPAGGLFDLDLSDIAGALDSLSKADLLLLKATERGERPWVPLDRLSLTAVTSTASRISARARGAHGPCAPRCLPISPTRRLLFGLRPNPCASCATRTATAGGYDIAPGFSFWTRAVGRENELGGVAGTALLQSDRHDVDERRCRLRARRF